MEGITTFLAGLVAYLLGPTGRYLIILCFIIACIGALPVIRWWSFAAVPVVIIIGIILLGAQTIVNQLVPGGV